MFLYWLWYSLLLLLVVYFIFIIRPDLEKNSFLWTLKIWEYRFGGKIAKITTNLKLRQNSVNQIFNLNALFIFLLTSATQYYHTIYLVFTYFALLTDYEDDIFECISNLHVQGSKFGGKINKVGGKSFFFKLSSAEFMEFVFFNSASDKKSPFWAVQNPGEKTPESQDCNRLPWVHVIRMSSCLF